MTIAPFPPLTAGGEGLDRPPASPEALRRRMAEVYGVDEACVLPVPGAVRGLELVLRLAGAEGAGAYRREATQLAKGLPEVLGFAEHDDAAAVSIVGAPGFRLDDGWSLGDLAGLEAERGLVVLDETQIEFSNARSSAVEACGLDRIVVLRSLEFSHGLAGAPCATLIANPGLIARLADLAMGLEIATPTLKLAEAVLDGSRVAATEARIAAVKAERNRMVKLLTAAGQARAANAAAGPFVFVLTTDIEAALASCARYGVVPALVDREAPGALLLSVFGDPARNDRTLAALDALTDARPRRFAEISRDTKETRIAVVVDLDTPGRVKAHTGVGYFDHMLEQIAFHGGFSLDLSCSGDLHIDAHHTIEDCALAFGTALRQALGERRGIARFGFLLPMDETEAKVSIDLSGRPFCVFKGEFKAAMLGEYPTEMTAHVFRSLSETLGAAIHVEVTGDNDHHKTEACFKAFGRALRQAVRIEGSEVPSTKGVL